MTTVFTVGPQGAKIRSDCRVRFTPGDQPLNIKITSKVQVLYGEELQETARQTLQQLGVEQGTLEIEDFGALPFVLMARIEAVVKQAYPEDQAVALPELKERVQYASQRERLRRSRLYLPGNQPKLWLNAGIHHPDAVILDLEDSVPPAEKDAARLLVRNALRVLDFFGAEKMVRINQGERGLTDVAALAGQNVHVILIPKVENAAQVQAVAAQVDATWPAEQARQVFFMPIIESAMGVLKALEIATAEPRNVALTIGLEDYTADLGAPRTKEGAEVLFARHMVVNAARAAGIQAIDSVFSDVSDEEGLRTFVRQARALGFDGCGCIHPRQIRPIHEEFRPSEAELEKARRIVNAAREAEARGLGVVALGSKMIDPPVVKRAQHLLRLAGEEP